MVENWCFKSKKSHHVLSTNGNSRDSPKVRRPLIEVEGLSVRDNAVPCHRVVLIIQNQVPNHWHALWHYSFDRMGEKLLWNLKWVAIMVAVKFQLTPSQNVVPEELLFPDKYSHYNEGVQVDPFTQHPENVRSECVLCQHCQDFTAYLADSKQVWGVFKAAFRTQA